MARIGSKPIELGDDISVEINSGNLRVKGPKGELEMDMEPGVTISQEDSTLVVSRDSDITRNRALHGLYRSLVRNMVEGVSEGYKKQLQIVGIGYRAEVSNNVLELSLGFSHPIFFVPPEGIDISVESQRGKDPVITIEGIDKQLVGQVAAKIRSLRPPEPYKGKGIRYVGEQIKRKAGKTAAR